MSGTDIGLVAAAAVVFTLVGFLALAETALTQMSLVKALALREEGRRGASTLVRLVEHREGWLNPLLFLTLLLNFAGASIVAEVIGHYFGALGSVLVVLGEVVLVFVVAEAMPKTWAVQHGERAALLAAPVVSALIAPAPMRYLARGLIGMSNLLLPGRGLKRGPFVSEEELLAMADVAEAEEVIEQDERALIHSIIEFGDTVVREVRVPRPDMVAVEGRDRVADVLEVAIAAGYSRIPVYEQGIDDIVGIVYVKDLMRAMSNERAHTSVREMLRPAHFVPETKRVAELMREMQHEKFHMAIVVDEYGGTSGLVTLEDLIEELVGEIVDEFDVEEPQVEWLPNGDSRVNARMPVDEINDLLHAALPEGDWDSVGGLVLDLLGHVPSEGESVVCDDHRLTAERVQGRRIGRVRISRVPPRAGDGVPGEPATAPMP